MAIVGMLGRLTSQWRWRAATVLVVLYALCLAAPTAVMALSDGSAPAHCLTDDQHGTGPVHVHQDGSSHHHSNTDDHGQAGKCCGLFCLSAIAPDVGFITGPQLLVAAIASRFAMAMTGRGSDRIDRPPRSKLSL